MRTSSCGLRLAAAALAMAAVPARAASAQTNMSVAYSASAPSSPTASDFQAGRFILGSALVTLNACGRATCTVRISTTSANPALRYIASNTTPANCTLALPVNANPSAVVLTYSGTSFPQTVRVYFCVDLTWTGSVPSSATPNLRFRVTQSG